MWFLVLLFGCLPEPGVIRKMVRSTRLGRAVYDTVYFQYSFGSYVEWYEGFRKKAAAWHRECLHRLDPVAKMQALSLDLVARREKARVAGIGPSDPRYPMMDMTEALEALGIDKRQGGKYHED